MDWALGVGFSKWAHFVHWLFFHSLATFGFRKSLDRPADGSMCFRVGNMDVMECTLSIESKEAALGNFCERAYHLNFGTSNQ